MNSWIDSMSSMVVMGTLGILLKQVFFAALLLLACAIGIKMIMRLLDQMIDRFNVERTLHTFIRTSARIVLWFVTVLIVASFMGIEVTSLIAVLSVAGLAVSLAVQNTLSNLAGGIMLLSSKPFKVGDLIEAGGVSGIVAEIGMVYTRMNTLDNKLISVPNGQISAEKIINFTAQDMRRVDLAFTVSYDAPVELVESTIRSVLDQHAKVKKDPAYFVSLSDFKESTMEYVLWAWCDTADYVPLKFELLGLVKKAMDDAGVEMTYPHVNVHMVQK